MSQKSKNNAVDISRKGSKLVFDLEDFAECERKLTADERPVLQAFTAAFTSFCRNSIWASLVRHYVEVCPQGEDKKQQYIAYRLGVDRTVVTKIENARVKLTLERLVIALTDLSLEFRTLDDCVPSREERFSMGYCAAIDELKRKNCNESLPSKKPTPWEFLIVSAAFEARSSQLARQYLCQHERAIPFSVILTEIQTRLSHWRGVSVESAEIQKLEADYVAELFEHWHQDVCECFEIIPRYWLHWTKVGSQSID